MGIIRHFERIDLAKKKKQEKEVILNKFNGNSYLIFYKFSKKNKKCNQNTRNRMEKPSNSSKGIYFQKSK